MNICTPPAIWLLLMLTTLEGIAARELPYYIDGESLVIPQTSNKCEVRIYGSFPPSIIQTWDIAKNGDATESLKKQGISFPKEGFAFFDKVRNIFIIATTKHQFELVEALLSVCRESVLDTKNITFEAQ